MNYPTRASIENHGMEAVQCSMEAYGYLFPDDRDAVGIDIMSAAMSWSTPETLEFLIKLWAEHLRKGTYHPNWFFAANRGLTSRGKSARELEALRLIASYGEDIIDASQTELHEVVDSDGPTTIGHDLQGIVAKYPWTVDQWNHEGHTPLTLAATNGNLQAVRKLVRLGCKIDQVDYRGNTPLILASANGHVDVVHYLLDAGCSVNATSTSGETALHFAANPYIDPVGDPRVVMQVLLSAGASAKTSSLLGLTPLHDIGTRASGKVTRQAAMARIRLLLEAGADINAMSDGKERPLERAIFFDQPEMMKCLIEAGAQITNLSKRQNLLHLASKNVRLEALQSLAGMHLPPLNVNQKAECGCTPWDEFIWALHTPDWNLGSCRKPTPQEQDAFVALYKKVRDRSLELDISRLQRIRQHLEDEMFHGPMTVLQSLICEKRDWEQWDSVRTYETIKFQVRERMVEAALESVDENIEVLQAKIAVSPWDQVSFWDPPKVKISYGHEYNTESDRIVTEGDMECGESTDAENDTAELSSDNE